MPFARRIATLGLLLTATSGFAHFTATAGANPLTGVQTESTCAAPEVGQISCDTQILVSGVTRKPLHPRPKQVTRKKIIAHIAAVEGQAAPQTMTPSYLQQAYDLTYLSANRGTGDTVAAVAIYGRFPPRKLISRHSARPTACLPAPSPTAASSN